MYNFDLPITETLLKPNMRKLTLTDLFRAFPEGKDRRGDFADDYEGEIFFSLDRASSPYGDLDVVFVDPEIPVAYAKESIKLDFAEPGSACLVERIRRSELFAGGYTDYSRTLSDIFPGVWTAGYLLGCLYGENSCPVFTVGEDNCTEMLVLVQSDQIKEADVLSELNQSVSFATAVSNYEQAIVIDLAILFNQDKTDIMLSNKHYRSLVHSMMGQLTQKFEWVCRDNGVKYDEAWMIDWYGNEIPPDLVEEIPLTSTGEGGYVRKTWLHPEDFICCVCYTDFDGTAKLIY